jgi:hypothetical protein
VGLRIETHLHLSYDRIVRTSGSKFFIVGLGALEKSSLFWNGVGSNDDNLDPAAGKRNHKLHDCAQA